MALEVAVLGLGNVGLLAAKLLHEGGYAVTGFDTRSPREPLEFPVQTQDLTAKEGIDTATRGRSAVVSAVPAQPKRRDRRERQGDASARTGSWPHSPAGCSPPEIYRSSSSDSPSAPSLSWNLQPVVGDFRSPPDRVPNGATAITVPEPGALALLTQGSSDPSSLRRRRQLS